MAKGQKKALETADKLEKAVKPKAKAKAKDPRAVVDVECTDEDCWTAGGFLSPGDKAKLVYSAAAVLEAAGKVKILG